MEEGLMQTIYDYIRMNPDRTARQIRRSDEVKDKLRQLDIKRCTMTPFLMKLKDRWLIEPILRPTTNAVWRAV
jgi:hypothetical protein